MPLILTQSPLFRQPTSIAHHSCRCGGLGFIRCPFATSHTPFFSQFLATTQHLIIIHSLRRWESVSPSALAPSFAMNHDSQAQFLSSRSRKVCPEPTGRRGIHSSSSRLRSPPSVSRIFIADSAAFFGDSQTPRREMPHNNQPSRSAWRQYGESSSRGAAAPRHHPHHLSLPVPQTHYQGDGYDFRRPIMSTTPPPPPQTEDVIDLTNEPDSPPSQLSRAQPSRTQSLHSHQPRRHRPPRFGRNIMADVVDLEDGAAHTVDIDPPSSPEVEFLHSTVRARPVPTHPSAPRRLLDVLTHAQSSFMSPTAQQAFREEIAIRARHIGRRRVNQPSLEELFLADNLNPNIDLTIDLDYQAPAFTMNEPTLPTPPPSYKAPSPAPEGFTRTVTDDDVVVCPNCDHELGTGEGLAQQIWVAKQCGHVSTRGSLLLCEF